ncbi:MAG: hypothetical protein PGMFKBFP_02547 [Anaerolineales bacterium]|nr:hypothetical protein [Anaerolineales bacterium]
MGGARPRKNFRRGDGGCAGFGRGRGRASRVRIRRGRSHRCGRRVPGGLSRRTVRVHPLGARVFFDPRPDPVSDDGAHPRTFRHVRRGPEQRRVDRRLRAQRGRRQSDRDASDLRGQGVGESRLRGQAAIDHPARPRLPQARAGVGTRWRFDQSRSQSGREVHGGGILGHRGRGQHRRRGGHRIGRTRREQQSRARPGRKSHRAERFRVDR